MSNVLIQELQLLTLGCTESTPQLKNIYKCIMGRYHTTCILFAKMNDRIAFIYNMLATENKLNSIIYVAAQNDTDIHA